MASINRPNFDALRRARVEGDNALNSPRLVDRLARDVDAMDADRMIKDATHAFSSLGNTNQDGSGRAETARGMDAPVLSLGQGDYRRDWPERQPAKVVPIWESVPRQFPKDDHIDHEVEIAIEYRFEKAERGTRDYPGEPAHVTAYAAFLPERFCRAILRRLTHEMLTTSFRVRTDGGTILGRLSEESVHDFIQHAGEKVCDVIDAVKTEADEQAASVEDPERYRR